MHRCPSLTRAFTLLDAVAVALAAVACSSLRRSGDAPAGRSASGSSTVAGKVQLAKVNARAYDTVGVNSFQALPAPFLIDNPTLEQRVPESDLAGKTLVGISKLGLVGLAMLPTDLRSRRACRVRWWRSRTTGHPHRHSGRRGRQGDLHRLGATPVGIAQADRPGVSLSTPGGR